MQKEQNSNILQEKSTEFNVNRNESKCQEYQNILNKQINNENLNPNFREKH